MAWVRRSRPCLAVPPALSPSTMNSSLLLGSVEEQSASLPGRFSRWLIAVLRDTACDAAREASRALAARAMRSTMAAPAALLCSRKVSRLPRMMASTWFCTSGLPRRSLVCPWNCGSCT